MIELREIDKEIARLEEEETNYQNCEKLTYLYTVRNNAQVDRRQSPDYSLAAYPVSEFLQACEGVPMEHILAVMDEHMEAIAALYPREYRNIIRKITK